MTSTADSILDEVLSERLRQTGHHGYTAAHDDQHSQGEILRAASNYLCGATIATGVGLTDCGMMKPQPGRGGLSWPWHRDHWRPGPVRRMLIKAAALIIAEIERIDRVEARRT